MAAYNLVATVHCLMMTTHNPNIFHDISKFVSASYRYIALEHAYSWKNGCYEDEPKDVSREWLKKHGFCPVVINGLYVQTNGFFQYYTPDGYKMILLDKFKYKYQRRYRLVHKSDKTKPKFRFHVTLGGSQSTETKLMQL